MFAYPEVKYENCDNGSRKGETIWTAKEREENVYILRFFFNLPITLEHRFLRIHVILLKVKYFYRRVSRNNLYKTFRIKYKFVLK